jgi:hypothetical protein
MNMYLCEKFLKLVVDNQWCSITYTYDQILFPRSPKGEGGILFYLCPSKIFFVAFFSVTVDGRNLIYSVFGPVRFLLPVCRIHSFWSTLNIYLLVVHTKKNNNSFILVYFCQRSQVKLFLQNLQKTTITVKMFFFVPTQKCMKWLRCCTSAQITSFLMNCTSNAKIV